MTLIPNDGGRMMEESVANNGDGGGGGSRSPMNINAAMVHYCISLLLLCCLLAPQKIQPNNLHHA